MRGVKRERILRVLMNQPDGSLTKYRVSKLSECSIGWTMEFLQGLEAKKFIKATKVLDKEKLLDFWFSIAGKPKHFDFFVQSPREFLQNIDLDYALTTYMAENLLNHYLFPSRTDIYVKADDLPQWTVKISQNGLVGKGNLRLLIYDEHTLYNTKKLDGLWVASVPQVLIDLRREGGVCQEAYEMMLEKYVR